MPGMPPLIDEDTIDKHRAVQVKALDTLSKIGSYIRPGVSEADIAETCARIMRENGITDTWYHSALSLVLVGDRTVLSESGKSYRPSDTAIVRDRDLVTVDLSPRCGEIWGDCARSFIVGDDEFQNTMRAGLELELRLHNDVLDMLSPDLTFGEIFDVINREITKAGFENLDFRRNLGHTIERNLDARRYIESGSTTKVADVGLFTFEPHIRQLGTPYGFKHENIYYLDNCRPHMLAALAKPAALTP
jgi:Xaa-Pro aminopeptidase